MKRIAFPLALVVVACGSRSGFDDFGAPPRRAPLGDASTDAIPAALPIDAQADATDITDAGVDAATPPCTLVPSGEPFRSIDMRGQFHADGMMLRRDANHVIQYGNLGGVETW